jgi:hypothetical protein
MGSTDKVTGLEIAAEDTGAGRFGQGAIPNMVTARAHRRTPDQPCADCLDHSLAAGRSGAAVPRRAAQAVTAAPALSAGDGPPGFWWGTAACRRGEHVKDQLKPPTLKAATCRG